MGLIPSSEHIMIYIISDKHRQTEFQRHLPDNPLEVEWNQAQHSCLPDWPNGKPIWVLLDLLYEKAQPKQQNDTINDITRQ